MQKRIDKFEKGEKFNYLGGIFEVLSKASRKNILSNRWEMKVKFIKYIGTNKEEGELLATYDEFEGKKKMKFETYEG